MQIQGLQKLTLLDYPGKMAATVFTAGCNFCCPFCHNASLVTRIDRDRDIPVSKVLDYLKKRKNILEGVCISGGEPLLQPGLTDFIKEVKTLGYSVKLDTNGSNLGKLQNLVNQSLIDYVAMDIKNIPGKYRITSGLSGLEESHSKELLSQVVATVDYLKSNVILYEFRTTLVKELHQMEDLEEIGSWLVGAKKYYLQKFSDSGDLIKEGYHSYSDEIMKQALDIIKKYMPTAEIRGQH
jgi:pyruvate formate lyase activating enzyme